MVVDKKKNFCWKIVVVYGSPYDDKKIEFIDELHTVMASWQGAILVGGGVILILVYSPLTKAMAE
jgi:hypothetical protein